MDVSYHVRWRLCNAFDVRANITELSPGVTTSRRIPNAFHMESSDTPYWICGNPGGRRTACHAFQNRRDNSIEPGGGGRRSTDAWGRRSSLSRRPGLWAL